MKKTILLLTLGLGLSTAAQAQYRGRGGNVSLGVKAGASLTNFVGPDAGNRFANRFGFNAGVFANIGFAKLFAFQPELLYSQKGAKYTNNSDAGIRLHYVDVPLAFHVNTDGFFFEAGPQVGFLVAAKAESGSVSVDVKNSYKSVDFGYLAGLGYQLKHGLGVGLRYNGAFTSFPNSSTVGNVTVQPRQRNSAFQLYATYSFN
ncbi:porin family protein [Hymenobacter sp. H14-R3]|uniref:porin family protein n=1 Tax=Hymenobacter sp. H14-R3 TaxID=3046308 RepID=UPI0024BA5EE9|nr:porin family protein [Hymenobacter sp. H14-R3]MDJ0365765.1 porin family protein [Hymenobacter sp. H14-R3]